MTTGPTGAGSPVAGSPVAGTLGALSDSERAATLDSIAAVQRDDGLIPWSPDTCADPWNHVEAAMALAAGGRLSEADRALEWLLANERPGGGWLAAFTPAGAPTTGRVDTNCAAYPAVGVLYRYLVSGDAGAVAAMMPAIDRAMALVLSCQRAGGEVCWEIDGSGRPGAYALVAASSSIYHALLAAARCAAVLGLDRPRYVRSAERLAATLSAHCSGERSGAFADKSEFAMDWYYPVLTGAAGESGERRLEEGRARFVVDGAGVRCRSDQRWVTTAETAECALAYGRVGRLAEAQVLLAATVAQRSSDGSYATGLVHPERSEFPPGERSTYSAAAVVLADDALTGGPTAELFGWPPLAGLAAARGPARRAERAVADQRARSTRRLPRPASPSSTNRPDSRAAR